MDHLHLCKFHDYVNHSNISMQETWQAGWNLEKGQDWEACYAHELSAPGCGGEAGRPVLMCGQLLHMWADTQWEALQRTQSILRSGISPASRHCLDFPWPEIPIQRVYEAKGRLYSWGEGNRKKVLCVFERRIALDSGLSSFQANHKIALRKI